ncbi:hypothetical protein QR77_09895 [Streptomyces sp. 150FB]|uniref:hypothetical protein n=1 Tax=Streptomyces sp. 150FB TaxID=1576605 RepID=UPI0005890CA5|nr:hypothetical protein [Streptomyces sp. 150FB]KIF74216.1 hypothetical protein QR77_09895 [Streptomyces sp. 150FB]
MGTLSDTTTDPGRAEHPAVRHLPPLDTWSDDQRRGAACAYCGGRVSLADVMDLVDLGERHDPSDNTLVFPRAHPRCAGGTS